MASDIVERLRDRAKRGRETVMPDNGSKALAQVNAIRRANADLADEAAAEIERLREREAAAVPSGWREIETAPITATDIDPWARLTTLVWGSEIGVCAGNLHRFEGRAATVSVSHLGGDAVQNWGVTHYMPLPAPPGAPEPQADAQAQEVARHRLHLAWRLRNGDEFKNLPPIAADEIKQIAGELEAAARPEPQAAGLREVVIEECAATADQMATEEDALAEHYRLNTPSAEQREDAMCWAAAHRYAASAIRALAKTPPQGE